MIVFDQVSKIYPGDLRALDSVSFSIAKGDMVFLAGHSGAGKSTILHLIAGIIQPTQGTVRVNGNDLSKFSNHHLSMLRRQIGIVFQDHKLLFDRNALENVMLPLQITGLYSRDEAVKRATMALKRVGLAGREKSNPMTFSGGEQQRLCIARVVVHNPGLILADEPSAHLDRNYALDIMELLNRFNQNGTTVVISAHDERLMQDYGGRIIRLEKGRFAV